MNAESKVGNQGGNIFLLDKQQTSMLKGIAILMMLGHHIISSGLNYGYYLDTGRLREWGYDLKACVCLFAFVTGYGLCCKSFSVKKVFPAAIRQWMSFWPTYLFYVFLVICLYIVIDGRMPFDGWNLLGQIFCVQNHIENFWYAGAFMLQVLVFFPLLCLALHKGMTGYGVLVLIVTVSLFKGSLIYSFLKPLTDNYRFITTHFISYAEECLLFSLFFLMGWIWRDLIYSTSLRGKQISVIGLLVITVRFSLVMPLLLTPLLVSLILICSKKLLPAWLCSFLALMGYYSFHMWLNHAFIYSYWLKDTFFQLPPGVNYIVLCGGSLLLAVGTAKTGKLLKEKAAKTLARCHTGAPQT